METLVQGRIKIGEGVYLNPDTDYRYSDREVASLASLRRRAESLLVDYGFPDYPNFATLKGIPKALPGVIKRKLREEPNLLKKAQLLGILLLDFPFSLKPKFQGRIETAEASARRLLILSNPQEALRMFSTPRADQDRRPADELLKDFRLNEVKLIAQRAELQVPPFPVDEGEPIREDEPWAQHYKKWQDLQKRQWEEWREGLRNLRKNGWRGQIQDWPIVIESSRFRTDLPEGKGAIKTLFYLEPEDFAGSSHILIIRSPEVGVPILRPVDSRNLLVAISTAHGQLLGQNRDLGFIPWTERSLKVTESMMTAFERNIGIARSQTESAISYTYP